MHHIFLAHSFITYLVGRLTAAHLGLTDDQQTIIQARNFKVNPSDKAITVEFPFPIPPDPFPTYTRVDKAWRRTRTLDKLVSLCTHGKDFCYYTFDTSTRYNQLLYNHKACKQVFVLEEGSGSYREASELETLYKWQRSPSKVFWDYLNYGSRYTSRGFLEPNTPVFALNNHAFPGVDNKTIVYNESLAQAVCNETKQDLPDGSLIIVHDRTADRALVQYLACFVSAMEKHRGKPMFQKFHPRQSPESISHILKANELAGFQVDTIDCSLESYIFDDRQYDFLGHHSSTLIYAKLFGKSAKCVFDFEWGTIWDFDGYIFSRLGRPPVKAVL